MGRGVVTGRCTAGTGPGYAGISGRSIIRVVTGCFTVISSLIVVIIGSKCF